MSLIRHGAHARSLTIIGLSLVGLLAGAVILYLILWQLEFGGDAKAPGLVALWSSANAVSVLSNLGEVMVAVLGIALTVIAILVQLAAYRYTPRITDLFVRDPVNMLAVGFFVVTSVLVLWVGMTLEALAGSSVMVMALVIAVSLSILGLLPYFAFIFYFLSPSHIIGLIRQDAVAAMDAVERRGPSVIGRARLQLLTNVEHLDDMAQNAVKKDDKAIAIRSLGGLADILAATLERKGSLPEAWFATAALAERDPDFVALHPDMIRSLEARRTWVEMKVLRGLEFTFRQALNRLPDIDQMIALHCRRCAAVAEGLGDEHALRLVLRYFNTFVRHALNASDVRAAYNVLNEYRELAALLMQRGRTELVEEIADRLRYYAHVAFQRGLKFVAETVAQDLAELLKQAHAAGSPVHDPLLEVFLEIDREPDLGVAPQEASLRGVRKAQVRLATYYLASADEPRARQVFEDMRDELPERLLSIRRELEELTDPEWWEVANRDTNWDYLPPDQRRRLAEFFGWFEAQEDRSASGPSSQGERERG